MVALPDRPQPAGFPVLPASWRLPFPVALPRLPTDAATWRVIGILFLVGAEAMLYGYSYPFFSLALEKLGLATWAIGLNASLAGAGILLVGPFMPRLIRLLGLRVLVTALFLASLLSFAAILAVNEVAVWFAGRFVMGICFAALWSTTEIWLNQTVDDAHRGRVIGANGTIYAAAQFLGPVALSVVGVSGPLPILVAMVPLAAGALVALAIRSTASSTGSDTDEAETGGLALAFSLARPLLAAAFLAGIVETAMQSLLPLYGLAHGLHDGDAARLVAVFSLGEAVLVATLGWMADRLGRKRALHLAALVSVAVAVMLPFANSEIGILGPALFLAGGVISGIYTLGVVQIGERFRGERLAVISTGFAMAYAAGSTIGCGPIGYAIDRLGSDIFPFAAAGGFVLLAMIALKRDRAAAASPVAEVSIATAEISEGETLYVEEADPAFVQVASFGKWQEGHLEEWFRKRSDELAHRRAAREAGAPALAHFDAHQPG